MRRLRYILVCLALGGALLGGAGCTERADRIEHERVPLPTGGSIETISVLETEDGPRVVAPARESVFVRDAERPGWKEHPVEWPEGWKQTASSPLAGVLWSRDSYNFPPHQRFTSHGGRLHLLTTHRATGRPKLLSSRDGGDVWSTAPLPERHRNEERSRSVSEPSNFARVDARAPLRLSAYGKDGLYLLDKRRVWRAQIRDGGSIRKWESVDLSRVDVLDTATRSSLPTVIRNYLPASENRPYELLTVFGDRLYVYRRPRKSDNWLLVSTLPTVDLELYAPAGSPMIYLLAADALYRSDKRGELWEKSLLERPGESPPRNRAIAFLSGSSPSEFAPPSILIGTRDGSIYRSEDGGISWSNVRKADEDARSITGLATEDDSDRVWASTEGMGVLRSEDGGETWERVNQNLSASRPLAIAVGLNDELVLGTRSGLYRLTGAPEDGHWDPYHRRATSAIEVDREASRIVSGTIGGAIVTERASGELVVDETLSNSSAEAPLFQPWSSPPSLHGERAVLSIASVPNSERKIAWSRDEGVAISDDGGLSWRREELNEALVSALEGSLVDNFLAGPGERLYLTSRGLDAATSEQLWRSSDGGASWSTVRTLPTSRAEHPVLLRRFDSESSGNLLLARKSRLARSTDGGATWSTLAGPWQQGTIRAFRPGSPRHTIVYNTSRSTQITFPRNVPVQSPPARSYSLVWPDGELRPRSNIREALTIDRMNFVMTDGELQAGTIPQGETQLPHAPAIIATVLFVFLLAGVSFWYLRFEL